VKYSPIAMLTPKPKKAKMDDPKIKKLEKGIDLALVTSASLETYKRISFYIFYA
jgi:hypothetical protein